MRNFFRELLTMFSIWGPPVQRPLTDEEAWAENIKKIEEDWRKVVNYKNSINEQKN